MAYVALLDQSAPGLGSKQGTSPTYHRLGDERRLLAPQTFWYTVTDQRVTAMCDTSAVVVTIKRRASCPAASESPLHACTSHKGSLYVVGIMEEAHSSRCHYNSDSGLPHTLTSGQGFPPCRLLRGYRLPSARYIPRMAWS